MKIESSEAFKDKTESQIKELQKGVRNMNSDELKAFRNNLDPDKMGFNGQEGCD